MTQATLPAPMVSSRSISTLVATMLLNIQFWSLFVLATVVFVCVAYPGTIFLRHVARNERAAMYFIRRSISWYGATVIRCGWPLLRVRFVDRAPDEKPPFVFVSNHPAASDAYLMAFLPFECIQVVNIWPSKVPIIREMIALAGYLKVREMPFEEFVAAGKKLLAENTSVIVFPEGTRSGEKGVGPFHGAGFRLAQDAGIKVCPLAIAGNENIPPRGSLLLRPGCVTVTKLTSISPDEFVDMTPFKLKSVARERIIECLGKPQRT